MGCTADRKSSDGVRDHLGLYRYILDIDARQGPTKCSITPATTVHLATRFLAIGLIIHAVAIRVDDTSFSVTSLTLDSINTLLWQQPIALITMAGLWVFRRRSQLIIYGKGAKGIPYTGQMWKFVVDWIAVASCLLLLLLAVIVNVVGYSLYFDGIISYFQFRSFHDAQVGVFYVPFAFYFLLTIVFVVTGFTLSDAFKRQLGHPDVVRHFPTRLRTPVNFNVGHSSDAGLGHALAHHPCTLYPNCDARQWYEQAAQPIHLLLLARVIDSDRERGMLVHGALWIHQDCC